MSAPSDLNFVRTRDSKARVIPRREEAKGFPPWSVEGREFFTVTPLSARDPSLALGMTAEGRLQFAIS